MEKKMRITIRLGVVSFILWSRRQQCGLVMGARERIPSFCPLTSLVFKLQNVQSNQEWGGCIQLVDPTHSFRKTFVTYPKFSH